jgi:acyl-CoA thioester hydrolase
MSRQQPAYADLVRMPAWIEEHVEGHHLDANDHVNIQHYLLWAARAVGERCETLGIGAANIESTGHTQFTAEYHLTYLGELRRGSRFSAHVRLLDLGARSLHAFAYVLDRTHERLSFTAELVALNIEMGTRMTAPFRSETAATLDAEVFADRALPWECPLSGVMGVR